MNKYELVKKIEEYAPPDTQECWDCSGWAVETPQAEVNKVMYALSVTKDVVNQAKSGGCDMIISHHPLFFVPLEYKDMNIYCAHTNLDKAGNTIEKAGDGREKGAGKKGTADILIEKVFPYSVKVENYGGFVRIVTLENPITIEDLKELLWKISPNLRYVNNSGVDKVQRIGFCAGSGSEFINESPCEAFVTGDLKFHTALEADKPVFDIGHFESEVFAKSLFAEILGISDKGVFAYEKSPFI